MADLSPYLAAYMPRFIHIESGGNPNARTGSYSGLLQMGPDEIRRYGGNGLAQGTQMYGDRANWFAQKYGREPTPTELYLTNQQGEGGISAHLANPDAPAWQNMYATAEGQSKGERWAKQAIWGNVPSDVRAAFPGGVNSLTSRDFMNIWQHKVEGTPLAAASPPALIPNAPPMGGLMAFARQQAPNLPLFQPTGPQTVGGSGMPQSVWDSAMAMSGAGPQQYAPNSFFGMLSAPTSAPTDLPLSWFNRQNTETG